MTAEQRLAQMREENKYAQYFERTVAPEYQHDFDVQTEIVTMGARILKNYRPSISSWSGNGQAQVNYLRHAGGLRLPHRALGLPGLRRRHQRRRSGVTRGDHALDRHGAPR